MNSTESLIFDCTGITQYKNESQLLHKFKQLALKRKKKSKTIQKSNQSTKKQSKNNDNAETELQEIITMRQQIFEESYTLKSPKYHPQSPSVHIKYQTEKYLHNKQKIESQREIINQLFQLFLQFLITINSDYQNQNYNYPIYSSNYDHIIYESNNNDSDYISVDKEFTNQHDDYILITKFLHDNNINPQQFYLKFNEIDSINMVHEYEHPLNSGCC
ncbi:hypothetical protein F8M41_011453 [Gigaspora margarita]|uniref:Uncharacterized protein n=1 Tax=Gigaspora margarita TaxID=4874 RepID=A0A8H3WZ55_GIGMA|nr:hypothetical protein F8M41_011453 [Gigaspora margarita]